MEHRNCQNCKNSFDIDSDDLSFYEKIQVPLPTFCPACRMTRRMAFMNIYSLYKRACDKCGANIVAMFHADKKQTVYCSKCWWADDWDGTEYSLAYDPSRPFFEQLQELRDRTPFMALDTLHSSLINTSYTNFSSHLKNSYALFFADYAENCYYSEFLNSLTDTADCHRVRDSELCYGSVGLYKCSRVIFSEECDSCVNVSFSKNCVGCTDCFGCVNLKKKSYCIFNEQYSREEYHQIMSTIDLTSHADFSKYSEQSQDFWKQFPVRASYGNSLNVNVSGDYVYESKNAHDAYLVTSAEDSRYLQMLSVPFTKDSYDYTCWGGNAERIYDSAIAGHGAYNIKFSVACYPNGFANEYCYYASSCKNAFGCINLKKNEYCILNTKYSKEEFEKLKNQIISDMKKEPYVDDTGAAYSYGEMLPFSLSPFGYNETIANDYTPLTKEQAEERGLVWFESSQNVYTPTVSAEELSDKNNDDDYLLKQIIQCGCGKCYRIIAGENDILKKLHISVPRTCPDCRRKQRFMRVNPPVLFNRECGKCGKNIQTAYAPDRPEVVYCDMCFQEEIS